MTGFFDTEDEIKKIKYCRDQMQKELQYRLKRKQVKRDTNLAKSMTELSYPDKKLVLSLSNCYIWGSDEDANALDAICGRTGHCLLGRKYFTQFILLIIIKTP